MTTVNQAAVIAATNAPKREDNKAKVGPNQGQLAAVNKLWKAYESFAKAGNKMWAQFAEVAKMTEAEGEPILKAFSKLAKERKEEFPSAHNVAMSYASRVRKGWKAGIAPEDGEGANAFYNRAKAILESATIGGGSEDGEDGEGNEGDAGSVAGKTSASNDRQALMKRIREELSALTNDELLQVANMLARQNASKTKKAA